MADTQTKPRSRTTSRSPGDGASQARSASTGGANRRSTAQRSFRTSIVMPAGNRQAMIELLNRQLANTFDLHSQTKHCHWNVKGPNFFQLHKLYDVLADGLVPHIDAIGERITALGGFAMGTARMAAAASEIDEMPEDAVDDMRNVEALASLYAQAAESARHGIDEAEKQKDMDTSDLLIDLSRDLDKYLWFLEAHVQDGRGRSGRNGR